MPLDIPSLFAGAGAAVLGGVAGGWATVRLGFVFQRKLQEDQQLFQKRLLDEQLAFQKKLLEQQLEFEKELDAQNQADAKNRHEQIAGLISYLRDTLNTKIGFSDGHLSVIAARLEDIAKNR